MLSGPVGQSPAGGWRLVSASIFLSEVRDLTTLHGHVTQFVRVGPAPAPLPSLLSLKRDCHSCGSTLAHRTPGSWLGGTGLVTFESAVPTTTWPGTVDHVTTVSTCLKTVEY